MNQFFASKTQVLIELFMQHWIDNNLIVHNGSKTIVPEENCPPTVILILTLNQTLTLTVGRLCVHRS